MAGHANFQVSRNKSHKGINIFKKNRNINKDGENITKSEKLMNGIAIWGSFYRSNPHRFVKEYLQINLKIFQQILLYMMNYSNYFMYLASRGQGKTWLTAVYCITRAILWADTKIVIASGTKSQSKEVIEKIEDLRKNSPNLQREISNLSTSTNDPLVEFHNGSWIKTVASNDNARSKRANLLIVDEFRMVDLNVITKVLRKFLTAPRQPKYLNKPEYEHLQERNKEIYLSSCWYKHHWSWNRLTAYFKSMVDLKKYFICGLPYQLAIKESLLMKDQVLDEMAEDDFDETSWLMEMECLFFGESEKAFFKFDELQSNRVLSQAIYPKNYYNLLKDKTFNYIPKKDEEIRIVSCDIAGMAGKQNDASVYTIFRLIPNKKGYERHIVYMESMNGGHTVIQATRIRQLFDDFDCNYLVLDTQNMGLGIYDQLCNNLFDKERKVEYDAWTCINDEKMAERCLVPNSPKRIYSVKGNSQFNSECAILLKDNLKRNKIKLLIDETEGRNFLTQLKGFITLPLEEQVKFEAVYKQITAFVNEMVNLENEGKDGIVKLKEPSNQRKDRYSSVVYGNFFASELEREYLRTKEQSQDFSQYQIIPEGGCWEESSTYSF